MMERLRLVLLTSRLSPAAGGLATSVPAMAHGLSRFDGLDVTVLGTHDPAEPRAWKAWGPKVFPEPVHGPRSLQYAPSMLARMKGLVPDVIDVQGLWTWPSMANLIHHRRYDTPYVVTPRGMLDPWARRNSAWKKVLASAVFENRHLQGAACLRATAEMEAGHFRDMGLKNPIAIIPNGVEIHPLTPRNHKVRRRVLFLSRIHPKKGIVSLLQVWNRLESRHLGWELVIAGIDEHGHAAEMKNLAARLNLKRVDFLGPVYGAVKRQLYRDADLFVLPTHAENFGLVIAEALEQEVPVITTRNAPWEGLETERCGWWISHDIGCLNAAMSEAMTMQPEALKDMGRRGRSWMQRDYDWDGVVERLRSVYIWVAKGGDCPECVQRD